MAFRRLSMRKIHTTLRLFFEAGLSIRAVARTLRVSPEVPAKAGMGEYLRRAQVAGLSWPLPEGMDERALEARLFPGAGSACDARLGARSHRAAAQGGHLTRQRSGHGHVTGISRPFYRLGVWLWRFDGCFRTWRELLWVNRVSLDNGGLCAMLAAPFFCGSEGGVAGKAGEGRSHGGGGALGARGGGRRGCVALVVRA